MADELDAAQRGAEQALAIGRQRSATPEVVGAWWLHGAVAWARGDLAAAEADIRQALGIARLVGLLAAVVPLVAALISMLTERGELQAAEAELEASGMAGVIPDAAWFGLSLLARGHLRLEQGRFEQAAEDFAALEQRTEGWGMMGVPATQAHTYGARAVAAMGERARARQLAEDALVRARHWGAPTAVSRAQRALGLATDGAAGLALLEEAAAMLDDSPAQLARAQALGDLGAALRRANHRADARAPLREALELARRCGAAGLAKRAHDELVATGEKVRRYTPIGVESLTPSERRVAEMAATGLTNRQIAQTLFLTVKTIETHLAAVFDKLGIHSRHALAAALGDGRTQPARTR